MRGATELAAGLLRHALPVSWHVSKSVAAHAVLLLLQLLTVCCLHPLQWFGGYVSPQSWAQLATADGTAGYVPAAQCHELTQPESCACTAH